jgi:hypothetical protein
MRCRGRNQWVISLRPFFWSYHSGEWRSASFDFATNCRRGERHIAIQADTGFSSVRMRWNFFKLVCSEALLDNNAGASLVFKNTDGSDSCRFVAGPVSRSTGRIGRRGSV